MGRVCRLLTCSILGLLKLGDNGSHSGSKGTERGLSPQRLALLCDITQVSPQPGVGMLLLHTCFQMRKG